MKMILKSISDVELNELLDCSSQIPRVGRDEADPETQASDEALHRHVAGRFRGNNVTCVVINYYPAGHLSPSCVLDRDWRRKFRLFAKIEKEPLKPGAKRYQEIVLGVPMDWHARLEPLNKFREALILEEETLPDGRRVVAIAEQGRGHQIHTSLALLLGGDRLVSLPQLAALPTSKFDALIDDNLMSSQLVNSEQPLLAALQSHLMRSVFSEVRPTACSAGPARQNCRSTVI